MIVAEVFGNNVEVT